MKFTLAVAHHSSVNHQTQSPSCILLLNNSAHSHSHEEPPLHIFRHISPLTTVPYKWTQPFYCSAHSISSHSSSSIQYLSRTRSSNKCQCQSPFSKTNHVDISAFGDCGHRCRDNRAPLSIDPV